jgi:hypothetical protein
MFERRWGREKRERGAAGGMGRAALGDLDSLLPEHHLGGMTTHPGGASLADKQVRAAVVIVG